MSICNKKKNKTRMAAIVQGVSLMKSKKYTGDPLDVYLCPCGCWHIKRKAEK